MKSLDGQSHSMPPRPPQTEEVEDWEKIIQKYTMKFWKTFDTPKTPRVTRGLERISKDVVDEFQELVSKAIDEAVSSNTERVVKIALHYGYDKGNTRQIDWSQLDKSEIDYFLDDIINKIK